MITRVLRSIYACTLIAPLPAYALKTTEKLPCTQTELDRSSPYRQALLALRCPKESGLKPTPDAQRWTRFLRAVEQGDWTSVDWSMKPADFRDLHDASLAFTKYGPTMPVDIPWLLTEAVAHKRLPPDGPVLDFALRISPCLDGSAADHMGYLLASEFNVAPQKFFERLRDESRRTEALGRTTAFGSCLNSIGRADKKARSLIAVSTARLVRSKWREIGAPKGYQAILQEFKRHAQGPEAIEFYERMTER